MAVSFVVTVYNKLPFLPRMLKSLRDQQGGFAREFIFVDDGSTDGSADFIAAETAGWQGVRILRQQNQGPAIAVNSGAAAARQPHIMFLDGDDMLAPHATDLLLRWIDRTGCGMIHGDGTWYDDLATLSFGPVPPDADIVAKEVDLHRVVKFFHTGSSGVFVRTQAFRDAGGCDARIFIQEHSLFLRVVNVTRVVLIDPVLSFAPRHVPGRVMVNSDEGNPILPDQTLHDRMLALAFFLQDNPGLAPAYASTALKNCATDAWKWLRRHGHAGPLSDATFRLWLARLRYGVKNLRLPMLDETAMILGLAGAIRRHAPVRLTEAGSRALPPAAGEIRKPDAA